ncbi:MAG: N-acetyltransferase family protein [Oceanicaulis sp.]
MTISVRLAKPEDAASLALVGAATFLESYAGVIDGAGLVRHCQEKQTEAVYAAAVADPAQRIWLAELDGAPVGYLHLTAPDLPVPVSAGDLEIKRIYVLSRMHGTGLGRGLLECAEDHARGAGAKSLLLGVYKENRKALGFYGRVGFETVGEREFDVGGVIYQDWVLGKPVSASTGEGDPA